MLRSLCIVTVLGVIAGSALPDVIDVTVNGSVSGSGSYVVACALSTPGCVATAGGDFLNVPYSLSGTNTLLGAFSASGSTPFMDSPGMEGFADQNTAATADSLEISLTGGYSANGLPFYSGSENNSITLSFDVTEESVVQLLGGGVLGSASNAGELLDSDGNVILTLPLDTLSVSTIVQPGMYQVEAAAGGSSGGSFGENADVTNLELYLTADITPAVPEPPGALVAALMAAMFGGYLVSRRRLVS
jgi:hypothetical protein